MKTLITIMIGLGITQLSFAQNAVEFFAGKIHMEGTEKDLGLVCVDSECKTLQFIKMDGRIPDKKGLPQISAEDYPSQRDAAIANFLMTSGLSGKDAQKFEERILNLSGSSSKTLEVSKEEFNQVYTFAKQFNSLTTLKFAGKIDERGSDRSMNAVCEDTSCTTLSIVLKNDANDPGTRIASVLKSSLNSLHITREKFRGVKGIFKGAKKVFKTIDYVTVGKSGSRGFYGDGGFTEYLGYTIAIGIVIGHGEAYALAVSGLAITGAATEVVGVATAIVEAPFVAIPRSSSTTPEQ